MSDRGCLAGFPSLGRMLLCLFVATAGAGGVLSQPQSAAPTPVGDYASEGEPGLWDGYDPAKLRPIPPPPSDREAQGTKAVKAKGRKPYAASQVIRQAVAPGPPEGSPTQRTGGLTGRFVYVVAGHGLMNSSGTWALQRPNLYEMVEDLGNEDQVSQFAAQYLRNAGATVIPLRDLAPTTLETHIIDNDDPQFTMTGTWYESTGTPFWGDDTDAVHYVYADSSTTETATARWTPNFTNAGYYPVFVWFRDGPDRSTNALYRVAHKGGVAANKIDQFRVGKGWIWIGTYYFAAGALGYVELSNESETTGTVVIADAVRFGSELHAATGYPMSDMCALEYNKYSKADTSVTSVSDVWTRPYMAAYMNNASVDQACYICFHSNASSGSARGAMTLTNSASYRGGPAPRQDEFAQDIIAQVDGDLLTYWGMPSRNNQIYTSSYGELAYNNINGEMTSTILEVAFHDNAADTTLMKTAGFRQDAARAVYQGIVDYFAAHGNPIATYLPDAPKLMSATVSGPGQVTLSWQAPAYGGRGAGQATGYVVYRSTDGFAFDNGVDVGNVFSYAYSDLTADEPYFFRVAAYNAGGESFPSETLGARVTPDGATPEVLIVSGFSRYDNTITPMFNDTYGGLVRRVRPALINGFRYVRDHGQAVSDSGYAFESASGDAIINGTATLSPHRVVDWILGRQSNIGGETFNSAEQSLVSAYLAAGGRMFVSGEELGYDLELAATATQADKDFLHNSFQVQCANTDGSSTNRANAVASSIFDGLSQIDFSKDFDHAYYDVSYPDMFAGLGGATIAMTYADTGYGAAVQYADATKRLVIMGFPFEMIHGASARADVMGRILDYLSDLSVPTPTPSPTASPSPTSSPTPSPTPSPTESPTPSPSPTQTPVSEVNGMLTY